MAIIADTETVDPSKDLEKLTGLKSHQLKTIARALGLPSANVLTLAGWAIVTSPGSRWLGKIRREYRTEHVGRVRDYAKEEAAAVAKAQGGLLVGQDTPAPDVISGGTSERASARWESLDRVELGPALSLTAHAMAATLFVDRSGQRNVGNVHGNMALAPENSTSFHPVEQVVVSDIQRCDNMNGDMKKVLHGYIADAILGPADEKTGERGNKG